MKIYWTPDQWERQPHTLGFRGIARVFIFFGPQSYAHENVDGQNMSRSVIEFIQSGAQLPAQQIKLFESPLVSWNVHLRTS